MVKYYFFTVLIFCFASCDSEQTTKDSMKVKAASLEKRTVQDITSQKSEPMKSIEEVMGKFDPHQHPDFVMVDGKYADQSGRLMHKEAYTAFIEMWEQAKGDGINLKIKSATRNFDYQRGIWERKWTGERLVDGHNLDETMHNHHDRALKILEYSSMPGTSRHHWGTDIDINAFENSYFENGKGKVEYDWLVAHAPSFGFCQPYTAKDVKRPNGYNEEKWHWSYLPVANQYLLQAKTNMNDKMISGFKGSETAVKIGVVERYILGINKACKE